jgi:quercetin dioxygenase-like cupin family protein
VIRHFTSHLSEIPEHHEGYRGRRLVTFLAGAEGYAHGIYLVLAPGRKILSHWHDDREAVFYCTSGQGYYLLEDQVREVGVGDAMFVPLMAVHGFIGGSVDFEVLDFALFSEGRSNAAIEECFSQTSHLDAEETEFGYRRTFFPSGTYGNSAVKWVGSYELRARGTLEKRHVPIGTEQLVFVERGVGTLEYLGATLALRSGSIAYLIAEANFAIAAGPSEDLHLVGTSSLPGRYPEPPFFRRLKDRYSRESV